MPRQGDPRISVVHIRVRAWGRQWTRPVCAHSSLVLTTRSYVSGTLHPWWSRWFRLEPNIYVLRRASNVLRRVANVWRSVQYKSNINISLQFGVQITVARWTKVVCTERYLFCVLQTECAIIYHNFKTHPCSGYKNEPNPLKSQPINAEIIVSPNLIVCCSSSSLNTATEQPAIFIFKTKIEGCHPRYLLILIRQFEFCINMWVSVARTSLLSQAQPIKQWSMSKMNKCDTRPHPGRNSSGLFANAPPLTKKFGDF